MYHFGVIEDRLNDPLKLGRCRVRILGLHTPDKQELPTEDLPWAIIMQPVTSAATSGVGVSPTGLVEGAFVVVVFQDEHKQQPIIIGSIAGIPQAHQDQTITVVETNESLAWKTADGADGADGGTSSSAAPVTPGFKKSSGEIKKPTPSLVPSEDCYNQIREEEKLSSLTAGKNDFVSYKKAVTLSENTVLYSYQDTGDIWTIGWGNTLLADNTPVSRSTTITRKQADDLLVTKVLTEFAAGVRSALKAPVTQSMFDSLVCIAYNTGVSGLKNSAVMAAVNSMEYEQAASQIIVLKTLGGKLAARRSREKALFIKDGFPRKDMSAIDPPADAVEKQENDATQNPVVKLKPNANVGENIDQVRTVKGFRDPNGVYPKIVDEPDINRLARHEKIDQTIVFTKEAARAKEVKTGGYPELGEKKHMWDQPKIPYNASYPYNHVRATETGHIQEFDDTEGSERIHTYHRAGTYEEIDKNGTRINRIVGDSYEIYERNGYVILRGTMNVTIVGNSNVRIENDSIIDVLGDVKMTVGGDMETGVTGDYKLKVDGKFVLDAKGVELKVEGAINKEIIGDVKTDITGNNNLAVSKSMETGVAQNYRINVASLMAIDAGVLAEQSGMAADVPLNLPVTVVDAEQVTMGKGPAVGAPEFPELTAPSRLDSEEGQYETPEDGDPAEYEKTLEAVGASSGPALTESVESAQPDSKPPEPVTTSCENIPADAAVDRNYRLSDNYVLRQLDPNNAISAAPVVPITRADIICNLKALAENCLEPIKKLFPSTKITSGYRNFVPPNGASNSDHLYGAAVDIIIDGFDRVQHYAAVQEIVKVVPAFTQIILEYRGASTVWIHVAFNKKRGLKMEKFTMNNGKTVQPFGSYILLG